MLFRKKPVIIEASQWLRHGDHPKVRFVPSCHPMNNCDPEIVDKHGWIDTLEGGHVVSPGDWIITGVHGEHYPCKPDIFSKTYEPAIEVQPDGAKGND